MPKTDRPTAAPSQRSAVEPFHAMDVLARANRMRAAGVDVISLAVGQPFAPAPKAAVKATRRFLEHGRVAYTDALGRTDLRQRLSRHYAEHYGCEVPVERIAVTTGSSAGFNLAFLAAFDVGDRIAIAAPGYPAYRNIIRALGLIPVEIEVDASEGYVLHADHLAASHAKTPLQGVLVASPANPTGTVTPEAELERLIAFAEDAGIRFISDEIYHNLTYAKSEVTALSFSHAPIVVNSFSKFYCMTGWRIGWMVLPPELVRPAERIGQSLYISAPELSQIAAMAALDAADDLVAVREGYVRNRAFLIEHLPKLGFRDIAPIDGGFYAYATVPDDAGDSAVFAASILDDCGVAITPGIDFDLRRGHRTVRLSYACDHASLVEAVRRMEARPNR
ncbi:pyridoxal phosphate-dependent aminotransferase [Aureimonas leprariae]|uniref:aspartate transaminase n=1 Tax=Plantimonas leprariae TaxID=2615207 RepID=A0A7V7TXR5_9HYPH|nr:aminotransferase class I/II-fold pyridoxal phosphate-dependent enzyme [Aureimonas leprariae]KAB0681821.1 aminotransferase class I/II-fold pyridoxal phosphate-dependent enzyme [Aureimonas leprariae]